MEKLPQTPPTEPAEEPAEEPAYSPLEQEEAWMFNLFKFGLIWIVFVFIFFFTVVAISLKK